MWASAVSCSRPAATSAACRSISSVRSSAVRPSARPVARLPAVRCSESTTSTWLSGSAPTMWRHDRRATGSGAGAGACAGSGIVRSLPEPGLHNHRPMANVGGSRTGSSSAPHPRIPSWKLRSAEARRRAAPTASMTSPSFPLVARATPMTWTSRGRWARIASSFRCSRPRWTASYRRRRPGLIGKLGGLAVLNLEGIWTRYEDADEIARAHRRPAQGRGDPGDAGDLPGADQGRADRPAHPGDQGARRRRRRLADSSARRALLRALSGRRAGHPGRPGHGHLGRARLLAGPRAQPQGVRPRAPDPGRARRLRLLLDRPAPHAHRRGGRARRRRPRRGLHHARRARHRRPAGDRDRRRRGRPLAAHARDRRVRPRDRRRRHAHRRRRRQGDRLRRGRR